MNETYVIAVVALAVFLDSSAAVPIAEKPQQQFTCRREDFLGTGCDNVTCSRPGADAYMYAGPYCACKPCPTKPAVVGSGGSSSEFDRKWHFCLVRHFKVCPDSEPPGKSPPAGNATPAASGQPPGGDDAGPSTTRTTTAASGDSETKKELNYDVTSATTEASPGSTDQTVASAAMDWIGLVLGLSILVVFGIAALAWWLLDARCRNRTTTAADRGEDARRPLKPDRLLDGQEETGGGGNAVDHDTGRMTTAPEIPNT